LLKRDLAARGVSEVHYGLFAIVNPCDLGMPKMIPLEPGKPVTGWIVLSEQFYRSGLHFSFRRESCAPHAAYPFHVYPVDACGLGVATNNPPALMFLLRAACPARAPPTVTFSSTSTLGEARLASPARACHSRSSAATRQPRARLAASDPRDRTGPRACRRRP